MLECLSEDKKNPPFIPLCKRGKEGDLDRIDRIDGIPDRLNRPSSTDRIDETAKVEGDA